ncbi:putative tricarboxylic transport membrane protein [Microbacterium sp. SORGH_AS 505]|uniref:tripartite tricarboxylate transporter TctB family protein n=1 Tax=Microbacterium sp. SORGH_AS_0505 TaxID=3041770 RepID=UPI002787CD13|nr:tripartite tricarboxylate transporter TctB family protein [Microbacterium sp. SORGH_AS_0505]MDQ1126769.1 putative tricarboxylic transport membrane protein [Microbacterium sp. SORGH_AS_0505]
MTFPANPTSASAVVGQRLRLVSGPGAAALLKGLTMPVILVAFATYLVVGIVTMRVPEGTAFPGPQFFPGIIAAGLYIFAATLAVGAIREIRATPDALTAEIEAARAEAAGEEPAAKPVRVDIRSFAWVVLSFLAFAFLLEFLGWIIAAGLLFWCVARAFGSTKWLQSLIVGLTLSSLAYIGFDMALGMPLPSGILGGF